MAPNPTSKHTSWMTLRRVIHGTFGTLRDVIDAEVFFVQSPLQMRRILANCDF